MKVIPVTKDNQHLFIEYCYKYRFEHDESDLYDSDLESFDPVIQPSFLLLNDLQQVIGATSIKILPYLDRKKRGRIVLLHVVEDIPKIEDAYCLLIKEINYIKTYLDHVYCFMPKTKEKVNQIVLENDFKFERYVWVLIRKPQEIKEFQLSSDLTFTPIKDKQDLMDWVTVRNEAFKTLKGSETPSTIEDVLKIKEDEDTIEMFLLKKDNKPIGTIGILKEIEDSIEYAFMITVAILPQYQGLGYGTILLRSALKYANELGYTHSMLSVNATNEQATRLYIKEGYTKDIEMICYMK